MPTELDDAVDWAAAQISVAVEGLLAVLPKDADLRAVTTELIATIGDACPEMKKFVNELLVAHHAVLELGVSFDAAEQSATEQLAAGTSGRGR